jgi:hypothetical protein
MKDRISDYFEPPVAAALNHSEGGQLPADAMTAYALASIAVSLRRLADEAERRGP